MSRIKKIFKILACIVAVLVAIIALLSYKKDPQNISYGVTYSKFYSDELGLPYKETFISLLDDLKIRKFRLAAYWPMIEPEKGKFTYNDMDFQIVEAQKRDAKVILAVGRRLPRWPECHIPDWAKGMTWDEQKKEILTYLEKTVNRYKSYDNITYWQVENEPYLTVFAPEHCGSLDADFLKEEIALVRKLDPSRPILVTDSGNLGLWQGAWRNGDAFGTSVYIYLWNPDFGAVKSLYLPSYYKFKTNLMTLLFGNKKSFLIELSLEPWLLESVTTATMQTQIDRMGMDKVEEILNFAKKTGFEEQYLWGVEWWIWMKNKGHTEYFEKAKEIFGAK